MKSFIAKPLNSILVNLRYLRFKLLKYKENNKKICNTFDHNFKNIPLYIMRKVSLERYYFVVYTIVPLLQKFQKRRLSRFAIKLFIYLYMPFSLIDYVPFESKCLKVLGKSVGLCKTAKRKDQLYIRLLVSVLRIICENFSPTDSY